MAPHFRLLATCPNSGARAGELVTPHGSVPTPAFLPVGSQGTVKALSPQELKGAGVRMVLANAYHLMLRPGAEVVAQTGGLHRFMGWEGPLLTDSGGYQLFSLARLVRVGDEGVHFRSHLDGTPRFLSPEGAVALQEALGADVIMALDHPASYGQSQGEVEEATHRTYLWAERCLKAQKRPDQALFAIVQGGTSLPLRRESALSLASLAFPGYAIGGLSLGESREEMGQAVTETVAHLPAHQPRYLMGVGSPEELVEGVGLGVDLFDSALPTRLGRSGALFTPQGRVNLLRASFRGQSGPVAEGCPCPACQSFSAAYLHHLLTAGEILGLRLATLHNLTFLMRLMEDIRQAILQGDFPRFREEFLGRYQPTNEAVRLANKRRRLAERVDQGLGGTYRLGMPYRTIHPGR